MTTLQGDPLSEHWWYLSTKISRKWKAGLLAVTYDSGGTGVNLSGWEQAATVRTGNTLLDTELESTMARSEVHRLTPGFPLQTASSGAGIAFATPSPLIMIASIIADFIVVVRYVGFW